MNLHLHSTLSIFQLMERDAIKRDIRNLPFNDSGKLYTSAIKYRVCRAYDSLPKGTKTLWCTSIGLRRSTISSWNKIIKQCNLSFAEQGRLSRG